MGACSTRTEKPLPLKEKMVVYQVVPRIFGNDNLTNKFARKSKNQTMIVAANFSDEQKSLFIETGGIVKEKTLKGVVKPHSYMIFFE